MDVKEVIERYIAEHDVSKAELARRVGVPVSTLKNWELGHQPGADKFVKLIRVTGGDVYDVMPVREAVTA
ncbi:MAG TPA: helix-turn-helix transcriptional regulator [Pseudomonadales bacterium]|nr:helix-turn-helix transcriptional regulator [Pseudomonadales bacterium]